MKHLFLGLLMSTAIAAGSPAMSSSLDEYLKPISGNAPTPSASEIATQNVLQLNTSMFSLYESAGETFRNNILARHPVILALFSSAGGRMVLYKPGEQRVDAPPRSEGIPGHEVTGP